MKNQVICKECNQSNDLDISRDWESCSNCGFAICTRCGEVVAYYKHHEEHINHKNEVEECECQFFGCPICGTGEADQPDDVFYDDLS
jgi:hypothetical protein